MNPEIDAQIKNCRLLAIGGSAGSFTDMIEWVKMLRDIPVVLIIHRNKDHKSNLTSLMQYFSKMKVKEAEDGEKIENGVIYIAPAGFHLTLDNDFRWKLLDTEPIWYCKPAIDLLFQSMAKQLNSAATAVLLSGANEDGAFGLAEIKKEGGLSLCIDPKQAEYNNMPLAAKAKNGVGYFFDRTEIAALAAKFIV